MTNLAFRRRLSRSMDNKASVITIPRPIALAWEQYDLVDLIFNGDSLVITPSDESKQLQRDERA
jgi:virulence-associated protein VagC